MLLKLCNNSRSLASVGLAPPKTHNHHQNANTVISWPEVQHQISEDAQVISEVIHCPVLNSSRHDAHTDSRTAPDDYVKHRDGTLPSYTETMQRQRHEFVGYTYDSRLPVVTRQYLMVPPKRTPPQCFKTLGSSPPGFDQESRATCTAPAFGVTC